jgi:outer membrane biosynthesis protein TonB
MQKFLGAPLMFGMFAMSLAACATSGGGLDRQAAPRAAARFDTSSIGDAERKFPTARNPQLPSVNRMHKVINEELGGVASVDIRLCIAPDGHVQGVSLVRGSSLAEFDAAVLRDAIDWQFSGRPGTSTFASTLRTCEVAKITYRVPG